MMNGVLCDVDREKRDARIITHDSRLMNRILNREMRTADCCVISLLLQPFYEAHPGNISFVR